MKNRILDIAFCVNDVWLSYVTVSIKSIIENNKSYTINIHIITDHISEANEKRLLSEVQGYKNVSVRIYWIDDTPLKKLRVSTRWPIYTWYRILLPQILSDKINKVLYLDADIVVVDDIGELFAIDMKEKSIAAVLDSLTFETVLYQRLGYESSKHYVSSGVLLMNLQFWRENDLTEMIIDWAVKNDSELRYPDQDAINYICRDTKVLLPLRFNILYALFYTDKFYSNEKRQMEECLDKPAIIHFTDDYKPWFIDTIQHPMYKKWIKYNNLLRTPVKRCYKSTGILRLKIFIWDLFHPRKKRSVLTKNQIREILSHY